MGYSLFQYTMMVSVLLFSLLVVRRAFVRRWHF
jgi:hypothetical protein